MSLSISYPSVNRISTNWFTVEDGCGKLKSGKLKSEYAGAFFEARDKMYGAQKAACAQAREELVDLDGLTQEQLDQLSATYDPQNMTYAEYRSFINDLCGFGYFTEEDKPLVYCGTGEFSGLDMTPVSYLNPRGEASLTTVFAAPGYASSFPFNDGNALAWTKYMSTFGTFDPSSGSFQKTEKALLFEKLQNILLQM